jgi:hypothetical protein
MANTPAGEFWVLEIISVSINGPLENAPLRIVFLPNGSIDGRQRTSDDLNKANFLLAPTIAYLHNNTAPAFDYWKLINWLYVSFYWTVLADLGQVAPTTYLDGNFPFPSAHFFAGVADLVVGNPQ